MFEWRILNYGAVLLDAICHAYLLFVKGNPRVFKILIVTHVLL